VPATTHRVRRRLSNPSLVVADERRSDEDAEETDGIATSNPVLGRGDGDGDASIVRFFF
jgi:hypothetical protein